MLVLWLWKHFSLSFNVSYTMKKNFHVKIGNAEILSFGKQLILYHTILTFNDPEKEAFWK